ncbi:MAG: CheR family methyltransferase, partial [Myxococcota bacterium]
MSAVPDRGRVLAAARRLGLRVDLQDPSLLRVPPAADEARALLAALTVGETSFHRYVEQFDVFAAAVLTPAALAGRPLRVLSAGCSTGEEAYTLAMTVREIAPAFVGRVTIDAFDVNPAAIARARAGRYAPWALRETPASARERWFRDEDGDYVVDPALRALVRFHERNLVEDDPAFWADGAWDAIFCRNVLMYLTPDAARAVVHRLARAIAPGGFLFLGHA